MKRSVLIGVLLVLAAGAAWGVSSYFREPREQPNVIVLVVDTLRADYLGCYGFEGDISPHIDQFAKSSIHFRRCSSPAPWTAPSVGSYFTSRYPFPDPGEGGAFRISVLPEEHETLAETYQKAGYETRAFVENGMIPAQHGFAQGFDAYSTKSSAQDTSYNALRKFLEWEESREDDEKPYFAYIHVMDVHGPYRYYPEAFDVVKDSQSLGPAQELTAQEIEDRPLPIGKFVPWIDEELGKQRRAWRGAYAAGVHLFDHKFGVFIKKLKQREIIDNAVFLVTSDHGEQLLENEGWGHGHNLQNYQTNVPLIVHYPKDKHGGTTIDDVVSLVDLPPTVAEMCSLPWNDAWEGRSLLPLIEGSGLPERPAYATCIIGDPFIYSIRQQDRLLIWNDRTDHLELQDVSLPSWKREDLSKQEPEVFDRMSQELRDHVSRLQSEKPAMRTIPMPEQMFEQARDLGYLQ